MISLYSTKRFTIFLALRFPFGSQTRSRAILPPPPFIHPRNARSRKIRASLPAPFLGLRPSRRERAYHNIINNARVFSARGRGSGKNEEARAWGGTWGACRDARKGIGSLSLPLPPRGTSWNIEVAVPWMHSLAGTSPSPGTMARQGRRMSSRDAD